MTPHCDCATNAEGFWQIGPLCEARERESWEIINRFFPVSKPTAQSMVESREQERKMLAEVVDEFEHVNGPVTNDELRQAQALWPDWSDE